MKTKRRILSSLSTAFILLTTSCASDVANRYYASEHFPARKTSEVEVLFKNPSRPYEVIADFQARDAGPAAMRRKAAKIGADAVIVSLLGGRYAGDWADAKNFSNRTYSRVTGTAIKYK